MYFMINKWIWFGLLFIIYYFSTKKYCCCFGTKHISISVVTGQNLFLSLRTVSSSFRLNLCDVCTAFIFVPVIPSFYAYILHPVASGFSLSTQPAVNFKQNDSDTTFFLFIIEIIWPVSAGKFMLTTTEIARLFRFA